MASTWEVDNTKLKNDLFFVAIIINVVGNFIDAMGWCIQKKAHNQRLSSTSGKTESFVKDKKWWAGFAVHAIGNVLAKISYAFGPASLLLPLDTLRIAFTTALSRYNYFSNSIYLNETVKTKEIGGIVIIIIAAAISTLFGPRPVQTYYTIQDIEYRYGRAQFLIAAAVISAIALTDYLLLKLANTVCSDIKFVENDRFYMLSYILIAAYFASWNVLLVKCTLEVVSSSFISNEIAKLNWTHWLTYINIIALITTTISIEYWRQKALAKYHTGYVVAIFTVLQIVGGILLSSIFFEEFAGMENYELIIFFIGIILSFIGVSVVSYDDEHHEQVKKQKTQKTQKNIDENGMIPMDGNVTVDYSSSVDYDAYNNDTIINAENEQLMEQ